MDQPPYHAPSYLRSFEIPNPGEGNVAELLKQILDAQHLTNELLQNLVDNLPGRESW